MIIPVNYRLDLADGGKAGTLVGTPRLVNEDGSILDSGEPVDLKAGQCLLFGPVSMQVSHDATFHNGETPKPVNATETTPAPQGKPAAPPPPSRRV